MNGYFFSSFYLDSTYIAVFVNSKNLIACDNSVQNEKGMHVIILTSEY
jgi:hypothetical protein